MNITGGDKQVMIALSKFLELDPDEIKKKFLDADILELFKDPETEDHERLTLELFKRLGVCQFGYLQGTGEFYNERYYWKRGIVRTLCVSGNPDFLIRMKYREIVVEAFVFGSDDLKVVKCKI